MMRWVLAVAALVLGAWYLRSRQRRDEVDEARQDKTPVDLQARVKEMAANASNAARQAATTAAEQAQGIAQQAAKTAGDAAASAQQTSGSVADRARQAVDTATEAATQGAATQQEAPRDTEAASDNVPSPAGSAVETDVNTPPSIRDTMQAELADVDEQVDTLRAQAEAPPDQAEKSAGETFGAGTVDAVPVKATQAPRSAREAETVEGGVERPGTAGSRGSDTTTQPQRRESAAASGANASAPEGQRPRPVAGEGTTTATGGNVNAISPTSDGATATGQAEPLPQGLAEGEPGTGGPAGSTQAPTVPDSSETPTTGMEQQPVVDRAAEVAERDSGKYIGNKKTRIFHLASSGNLPGEDNRVYFESEEEALAAGFTPAANEDLQGPGS